MIIIRIIFEIIILNLIIKRIRIEIISLIRNVIIILLISKEKYILYISLNLITLLYNKL